LTAPGVPLFWIQRTAALKSTISRIGLQTFGVVGPRVRSGPFEGPAHVKPPALPVAPDWSTANKRVVPITAMSSRPHYPDLPVEQFTHSSSGVSILTIRCLPSETDGTRIALTLVELGMQKQSNTCYITNDLPLTTEPAHVPLAGIFPCKSRWVPADHTADLHLPQAIESRSGFEPTSPSLRQILLSIQDRLHTTVSHENASNGA
jgi:hypothetical protein